VKFFGDEMKTKRYKLISKCCGNKRADWMVRLNYWAVLRFNQFIYCSWLQPTDKRSKMRGALAQHLQHIFLFCKNHPENPAHTARLGMIFENVIFYLAKIIPQVCGMSL